MKTDCITDDELAAWAQGAIAGPRITSIQEHVASCTECRTVAAEVARTSGTRPKPKTLGRYELREPVGVGGMGTVFAAWDPKLQRQVAVKLLHEAAVDGHRAERFNLERQVLASLEHPHIARLLDAGETDEGRPWFAMDFVDGKPLDRACTDAKLDVHQRLRLMLPVLRAVTAAHQHLVVHRDLKPSNILVDANGEPHLVDFGIARLLEGASGLTQTGVTPMTPAYASPEQVRREPVAVTTDVYSLGVVLYELLAGVSPYETTPGDVEALLVAVTTARVRPPSEAASSEKLRASLEGDLDAIVLMALRKEPRDRYQSVQALTDDLTAFLEGRPTLARRGDRSYRAALFVRRNRALVAGLTTAFVALSVGLVATVWQARRAEAERDLARSRFEQVRQLAKAVLFDYHDGIADLPGSTPLRQRLVKDAQGYLEALSAQMREDDGLKQELASSYLKLGDVQGDPFAASLGDTAAAKQSYLRGRALAESILQRAPNDWHARRALASSREKLGAISEVSGDIDDALAGYEAAVALDTQLLAERPDDLEQRFVLSRDELSSGLIFLQLGKLEEASTRFEHALKERRAVAAKRPDEVSLRGVAILLIYVGSVRGEQGRLDEGIAAGLEAEKMFDALVTKYPTSNQVRRGLGRTWALLEQLYRLSGRKELVLTYAKKEVEQSREAVKADPQNAVASRDIVVALSNLAIAYDSLERRDELRAIEKEALALQRALTAADPENLQTLRDLVVMLGVYGAANAGRGEYEEAERKYAEQAALGKAVTERGADISVIEEELVMARDTLANIRSTQGRFEDAKLENQRLLDGLTAILKKTPELKRVANRVAIAHAARAEIFVRAAEKSGASADWERARLEVLEAVKRREVLEKEGTAVESLLRLTDDVQDLLARCDAALTSVKRP